MRKHGNCGLKKGKVVKTQLNQFSRNTIHSKTETSLLVKSASAIKTEFVMDFEQRHTHTNNETTTLSSRSKYSHFRHKYFRCAMQSHAAMNFLPSRKLLPAATMTMTNIRRYGDGTIYIMETVAEEQVRN